MTSHFEKLLNSEAKVRGLAGLSVKRLQVLLKDQNFALVLPTAKIPIGWPAEIVKISQDSQTMEKSNFWYMSNGKEWRQFYCFCLTTYMTVHKTIPAFIYERKIINGKCAYAPVVDLMMSLGGRVKRASTGFCRLMRQRTFGRNRARPLNERFGEDAKAVFAFANAQARKLRHNRIGTEHILLGLLHKGSGKTRRAMNVFGGVKAVRRRLAKLLVPGSRETVVPENMPFTSCGKRVLSGAGYEAEWLGDKAVRVEHILLSLFRVTDGRAAQALPNTKLDAAQIRLRLARTFRLNVKPVESYFGWARHKEPEALKFCQTLAGHKLKAHGKVNWCALNEDVVKYRGDGVYEVRANCEYLTSKFGKQSAVVHAVLIANREGSWGLESFEISRPIQETHRTLRGQDALSEKSRFEDVDIPNIGNLTAFETLSVQELREMLPPSQYALYVAKAKVPDGWPSEAVQYGIGRVVSDGRRVRSTTWFVTRDGRNWKRFYGSCHPMHVEKYGRRMAFIYECIQLKKGNAYIPRVVLTTTPEGKITKASARWCTEVLKVREREQQ